MNNGSGNSVIIVCWVNSVQEEQRQKIQSVYVCCVFHLELIRNKVMEYISLVEGTATHRAGYPASAARDSPGVQTQTARQLMLNKGFN